MTLGLTVRELSKHYGATLAVDNVSLTIPAGELACFLGPSGCGKTSLLRMIAGLESPSAGHIYMNDRDITQMPAHQRNFAMVFQDLALFPFLSVEDNIAYNLKLRNFSKKERRARVRELLELIKLPDIGERSIQQLSGGQKQRVAIARALAQEPMLFLLDEPLSALDAKLRDHMQIELRVLQRKLHITTILVTHDQHEAMSIADRIIVMADGKVQQIGKPAEIYRNPANRFVAGFIGRSNLLEATVVDATHLKVGDYLIEVAQMPAVLRAGEAVTAAVRPERIRVLGAANGGVNCLPGEVILARDIGGQVEYRIDCQGREICGTAPIGEQLCPSTAEKILVQLPVDACTVLVG